VSRAPALTRALEEIAGLGQVVTEPAALAAAAVDGLTPRWIARPASVDQVAGLLGHRQQLGQLRPQFVGVVRRVADEGFQHQGRRRHRLGQLLAGAAQGFDHDPVPLGLH